MSADKVAVITGANKGIGFAVVKALCERFEGIVYLTSRDENRGLDAVKTLQDIGLTPAFHKLDVSDKVSVRQFAEFIKNKHGGFDVLVNNAAVLEWEQVYPTYEAAKQNIDVNYRSLLLIEQYLYPLLRVGARVVNISSDCGHLSNLKNKKWLEVFTRQDFTTDDINNFVDEYLDSVRNGTFNRDDFADGGKHAEHRVSKIALTALTMVQQRKYPNISINALHPGNVKTEMGLGVGEIELEEAAKTILYLIFDASPNLKGTFMWYNGKLVDWFDVEGDYYYKHRE